MIHKLSKACYAVRWTLSNQFIWTIFTLMKYGIIFRDNSSNSKMIFTSEKNIVRIMADAKHRNSRRNLLQA